MAERRRPPPLDVTLKREFKLYNPNNKMDKLPELTKIPDLIFLTDILPNLAIGTLEQAQNIELLQKHAITHVLNITRTPCPDTYVDGVDGVNSVDGVDGIKSLQIAIDDTLDTSNGNLIKHFPEGFKFIDSAIENNGKILVHCHAGISRSPAFVIGYIMWKENGVYDVHHGKIADYGKLEHYMAIIRKYRPGIGPNLNFCGQLIMFYNAFNSIPNDGSGDNIYHHLENVCADVLKKM